MSQSLSTNAATNSVTVLNALVPPEGPKCVPTPLDFRTASTAVVDFTLATMQAKITTIQAIWVDNSANGAAVTIQSEALSQNIVIPAGYQCSVPVAATNRPKFLVSTTAATGLYVTILWFNVPLPGVVIPSETGTTGAGTAALHTTIAAGGTAVTVFGGTVNHGRVINPFNATESLFLDYVNTAGTVAPGASGTTFELVPGQSENVPDGFTGTLTANAATNGHTFTAFSFAA
jgi:hypothetical protein